MVPHGAANCIDNSHSTFCHSLDQSWPWLSVGLPTPSTVSHIVVYNRRGQGMDRLSPFQLWVGASAGDYDSATSAPCGLHNLTAPATAGPFAFACGSLSGAYVTLVLPGPSRTLHVAELRAYT